MAYVSQQRKAELAPGIKAVLAKYGMKGSIAVRHHSTLVVNIVSGPLDIIGNAVEVGRKKMADAYPEYGGRKVPDHLDVYGPKVADHFSGEVAQFLSELHEAMSTGNWDKSDIQTDYFNVGWYSDIRVGKWDKPYQQIGPKQAFDALMDRAAVSHKAEMAAAAEERA